MSGSGITRRDVMRRSAVVGAGLVWATPVVQSLARPAFAGSPLEGECFGCLTGGGQLIVGGTYNGLPADISFGLSPICCGENQPGTELQLGVVHSKPKEEWHFNQNLVVSCTVDPTCSAEQPAYCANVFTGTIADSDGNVLSFVFTDCGEPGQKVDKVTLSINGPGGGAAFLQASGQLTHGNLQAHVDLGGNPDNVPPVKRVCNC